jgi:hypothetical protein
VTALAAAFPGGAREVLSRFGGGVGEVLSGVGEAVGGCELVGDLAAGQSMPDSSLTLSLARVSSSAALPLTMSNRLIRCLSGRIRADSEHGVQ